MRVYLALWFLLLVIFKSVAQENFISFFEPEIEINYTINEAYKHSFGIENRNFIYKNYDLRYSVKQIDVSHFSEFTIKENQFIGLGIQYRFEESFNKTEENELRFMQEWEWGNQLGNFNIKNRLRNEQRLYASTIKYRLRYELGLKFWLLASQETYLKTETETLFELAKTQKPELEQRVTVLYGFRLLPKTALELGAQYRLADYTQNLGYELFMVLGLEISL